MTVSDTGKPGALPDPATEIRMTEAFDEGAK